MKSVNFYKKLIMFIYINKKYLYTYWLIFLISKINLFTIVGSNLYCFILQYYKDNLIE